MPGRGGHLLVGVGGRRLGLDILLFVMYVGYGDQRAVASSADIVFKDRAFTPSEVGLIREVVAMCGGLSRQELAKTVCELLGWHRANGGLKTWECKELLAELDGRGVVDLPVLRATKPRGARTKVERTDRGRQQEPLIGTVRDVAPVSLRLVRSKEDRDLWRELVDRYHYLGHKVPFGAHLRYLVEVARPEERVVGCVQLSSPAWKMAVRDGWIGWDDAVRCRHLQRVVNQSRFLLLPWVQVRNLASHVLAKMVAEFPADWERAYGIRPLLVETLVDSQRYRGSCYRAANWQALGKTQGRGRMDREHRRHQACPKEVFVYPLVRDAQQALLRDDGVGGGFHVTGEAP